MNQTFSTSRFSHTLAIIHTHEFLSCLTLSHVNALCKLTLSKLTHRNRHVNTLYNHLNFQALRHLVLSSKLLSVTSKILGSHLSRVPFTKRSDGGPLFTWSYMKSLNHTEFTSGTAEPKCGGQQLVTGRISWLKGAMDTNKLKYTEYILRSLNLIYDTVDPHFLELSSGSLTRTPWNPVETIGSHKGEKRRHLKK